MVYHLKVKIKIMRIIIIYKNSMQTCQYKKDLLKDCADAASRVELHFNVDAIIDIKRKSFIIINIEIIFFQLMLFSSYHPLF